MLSNILQGIIDFFEIVVNWLLGGLPDSPFQFEAAVWPEWVQSVGVVIPIPGMIAHTTAFVTAILTYYAVRWLLRMVRAVQ